MQIGYSEDTLRMNICKQFADIESEFNWMKHYFYQKDWDCVEDQIAALEDKGIQVIVVDEPNEQRTVFKKSNFGQLHQLATIRIGDRYSLQFANDDSGARRGWRFF